MKVLVIDSAARSRKLLGDILAQSGQSASLTSDSQTAVDLLRQEPFDMLFTELDLPGEDGISVLAQARRLQPGLSAIIMAHQPSAEACVAAMRLGAIDCVFKPLTTEKITAALLRASRTAVVRPLPQVDESSASTIDNDQVSIAVDGSLKQMQANFVHQMIRRFDGNKTAAAKALGMHRRTLYRILARSPRVAE